MEAFSLLKYWRASGGGNGRTTADPGFNLQTNSTTTIVTAVNHNTSETDSEDDDDDGPFFDLEFAVPDEEDQTQEPINGDNNCASGSEDEEDDDEVDGDGEFNFTLSSGSSNDRADNNLSLSPSDDLFFKGRLVPIEEPSNVSEPNSKPQFPVSLLKSATKFRVFMMNLKKSKSNVEEKTETNGSVDVNVATKRQQKPPEETPLQPKDPEKQNEQQKQQQNKSFTVKFKVEEVPIMSLFTRDNSSRINSKSQKRISEIETTSDEKRFSKDVMQKYLKKVKPLYIRVSRRYGEKLRFSGQLSLAAGASKVSPPPSTVAQRSVPVKPTADKTQTKPEVAQAPANNLKSQKQGNFPAGLRVVCKHLGKSRSASSAVDAVSTGPAPSRRDDSLLQQQDGIQSAILHCKRSFNASRDSESMLLSRSVSDPLHEKSSENEHH